MRTLCCGKSSTLRTPTGPGRSPGVLLNRLFRASTHSNRLDTSTHDRLAGTDFPMSKALRPLRSAAPPPANSSQGRFSSVLFVSFPS
jgi:hypothetical protein